MLLNYINIFSALGNRLALQCPIGQLSGHIRYTTCCKFSITECSLIAVPASLSQVAIRFLWAYFSSSGFRHKSERNSRDDVWFLNEKPISFLLQRDTVQWWKFASAGMTFEADSAPMNEAASVCVWGIIKSNRNVSLIYTHVLRWSHWCTFVKWDCLNPEGLTFIKLCVKSNFH